MGQLKKCMNNIVHPIVWNLFQVINYKQDTKYAIAI